MSHRQSDSDLEILQRRGGPTVLKHLQGSYFGLYDCTDPMRFRLRYFGTQRAVGPWIHSNSITWEQSLCPLSRLPESESAFKQDFQVICMHKEVRETLRVTLGG